MYGFISLSLSLFILSKFIVYYLQFPLQKWLQISKLHSVCHSLFSFCMYVFLSLSLSLSIFSKFNVITVYLQFALQKSLQMSKLHPVCSFFSISFTHSVCLCLFIPLSIPLHLLQVHCNHCLLFALCVAKITASNG